ncbi:MAG: hypothetical protein AABM66_12460 [Actinomycetota bacterium]
MTAESPTERARILAERAARQRVYDRDYRRRRRAERPDPPRRIMPLPALGLRRKARWAKGQHTAHRALLDKIAAEYRPTPGQPWYLPYRSAIPATKETLEYLERVRHRLRVHQTHCPVDSTHSVMLYADDVLRDLAADIDYGRELLAGLRKPGPPMPPRKWRRWTEAEARAALVEWANVCERWPGKGDLADAGLPSYGTVHRLFGGLAAVREATGWRPEDAAEGRAAAQAKAAAEPDYGPVIADADWTEEGALDRLGEWAYENDYWPEDEDLVRDPALPSPEALDRLGITVEEARRRETT